MKKFLTVIALGVFGTALAACPDIPYYPIAEGASWTYDLGDGETITQTMRNVTADGFTMEMDVGDQIMSMEFLCGDNGVLSVGGMPGMEESGLDMNIEVLEADGVQYPTSMAPGETWSYSMTMAMQMTMEGMGDMAFDTTSTVNADNLIEAFESVTVAAGTFNALKMVSDTEISSSMSMMGMAMPATVMETTSTTWLVEGIGMVLSVDEGSRMELISYSIP